MNMNVNSPSVLTVAVRSVEKDSSLASHIETLMIYKLNSRKFTTHNDLHQ
jgi:hypothetical protein